MPSDRSPSDDEKRLPSDDEKRVSLDHHNGGAEVDGLPADPDAHLSEEEKAKIDRALLWRLDLKLIPWLCLLYLISFLDRTNIGNARLAGLDKGDRALEPPDPDGTQYNIALTIFFISYSLFEPLTNILLKRLRPSIFLPITMLLWGVCMTLMGLVHSWQGLYVVRFFLGLTEAGLFPGVNYYLSCWYKRKEFGIRAAIFFSAAALAGSFGGLLAYGIQFMNGIGNKAGWAWIFILEGIFTVFIGIASFWMVHDFPDEAKFLKPDDRARVIRRLKVDKQASANHESFQMKYFWAAMKDYKTWLQCVIYMGCDGPLYCFSLFLPTIISTLGTWSPVQSQLLSVPPYALAAILTITVGYVADRTQQRGLCNIVMSLFGIAGFSMLLGSHTPGVQYAGTFLAAAGIYPCISNTITWGSNNFEGVYKRGVAIGVFIGWGNLNGIMASNVYLQREKPRFWTGHGVVIAYLTLFLLGGSITQHLVLKRENAARRAGKRDHTIEGLSEKEIEELGDKKPDFMYTL